ncbi:MAG: CNNM domain-containing protein, partial [Planctomycetota bacterium]
MLWLLIYLAIAIGVSFLCSILEAVLLSITPTYIASRKGRLGHQLRELKGDIDRPLAAILTLNTFAHTIGAAGVGAQAQALWGEASLTVVSAVVTILILIASEIIPKTIGAVYWQRLTPTAVAVIRALILLLLPLVAVCQALTRLLRHGDRRPLLSRADIASVAETGYRDGILRRNEQAIIANLMSHQSATVSAIMTPRERIIAKPLDCPLHAMSPDDAAWFVSRIVVYPSD